MKWSNQFKTRLCLFSWAEDLRGRSRRKVLRLRESRVLTIKGKNQSWLYWLLPWVVFEFIFQAFFFIYFYYVITIITFVFLAPFLHWASQSWFPIPPGLNFEPSCKLKLEVFKAHRVGLRVIFLLDWIIKKKVVREEEKINSMPGELHLSLSILGIISLF